MKKALFPPVVCTTAEIDYSTANWDALQRFFRKQIGRETSLQELSDGVIYLQLMANLFPFFILLENRRIRQSPRTQMERIVNWRRLQPVLHSIPHGVQQALELLGFDTKVIDVYEMSRCSSPGNLNFCRWFAPFYTRYNFYPGRPPNPPQYAARFTEDFERFLNSGVRRFGRRDRSKERSLDMSSEEYCVMVDAQPEFPENKTYGREIWRMLGKQNGKPVSDAAIAKWTADLKKMEEKNDLSSMWDYNPRCLPKEFDDLDLKQVVRDASKKNLALLPMDVLVKICEKLLPSDFINLSLTCRYLHWRMFAFGRCIIPRTAGVSIKHEIIKPYYEYEGELKELYKSTKGVLRGVFVKKSPVLKRPFVFDSLELEIRLPLYNEVGYGKCLPFIQSLRQRFCHLYILFYENENRFDYPATDNFFKMMKPRGYRATGCDNYSLEDDSTQIFLKCPQAQQMKDVRVGFDPNEKYPAMTLTNQIGYYQNTPIHILSSTVKGIVSGSIAVIFHGHSFFGEDYYEEEEPAGRIDEEIDDDFGDEQNYKWFAESMEIQTFILTHFINLEEFVSNSQSYIWKGKFLVESTQKQMIVELVKSEMELAVLIGVAERFDEMEESFERFARESRDIPNKLWKMETAVGDREEMGDE